MSVGLQAIPADIEQAGDTVVADIEAAPVVKQVQAEVPVVIQEAKTETQVLIAQLKHLGARIHLIEQHLGFDVEQAYLKAEQWVKKELGFPSA